MKNLRLVFKNENEEKTDITYPMEKWISDWWFNCDFVPTNDTEIILAELDGADILAEMSEDYRTFEDVAYKLNWDGLYDDFYGISNAAERTIEKFEKWLREKR